MAAVDSSIKKKRKFFFFSFQSQNREGEGAGHALRHSQASARTAPPRPLHLRPPRRKEPSAPGGKGRMRGRGACECLARPWGQGRACGPLGTWLLAATRGRRPGRRGLVWAGRPRAPRCHWAPARHPPRRRPEGRAGATWTRGRATAPLRVPVTSSVQGPPPSVCRWETGREGKVIHSRSARQTVARPGFETLQAKGTDQKKARDSSRHNMF
ncbi:uncharacterized protein LOC126087487 [Elephas maximus indicus]|uniref:uncharacterized protein LOC126087487 n=1 Tax=Elephas maximus indicus TaxID=99487 RepID=UPI002115E2AE|nr:uncharacterized protein LOC126087487 [Elephas maximus indicus]